jgi:hypothetical protein
MAANVAVTITGTTPKQQEKLAEFLSDLNVQRVNQELPPYPTVEAWASDFVYDQIKANIRSFELIEGNMVREAYIAADDTVQGQVRTLLDIP